MLVKLLLTVVDTIESQMFSLNQTMKKLQDNLLLNVKWIAEKKALPERSYDA